MNINKKSTYTVEKKQFTDAEIILYGEIVDMGGQNDPNIHIVSESHGKLTISCTKEHLAGEARLYTICGIRAIAKQDVQTGGFQKNSFRFIEFIDYKGGLRGSALNKFIQNGTKAWKDTESVQWQRNLRGYGN